MLSKHTSASIFIKKIIFYNGALIATGILDVFGPFLACLLTFNGMHVQVCYLNIHKLVYTNEILAIL